MKHLLLVMMSLLLFSCGAGKEKEKAVSAVDSTRRVDELVLGYRLGMSRDEAGAVTDSLVRTGEFSGYTGRDLTVQGEKVTLHGYPHAYKVGDKQVKTIVKPIFRGGNLLRLNIYVLERDVLDKALVKEYGPETVVPENYTPEAADNVLYFSNQSNKAIYYLRFPSKDSKGGYDMLVFEDIIGKWASAGKEIVPRAVSRIKNK